MPCPPMTQSLPASGGMLLAHQSSCQSMLRVKACFVSKQCGCRWHAASFRRLRRYWEGRWRQIGHRRRGKKNPACRAARGDSTDGRVSQYHHGDDREWGGCAEASARRLLTTGYHPVGKYSNNPLDHLLSQTCLTISIRVPTREDQRSYGKFRCDASSQHGIPIIPSNQNGSK